MPVYINIKYFLLPLTGVRTARISSLVPHDIKKTNQREGVPGLPTAGGSVTWASGRGAWLELFVEPHPKYLCMIVYWTWCLSDDLQS